MLIPLLCGGALAFSAPAARFFHTFTPSETDPAMDPPQFSDRAHLAAPPLGEPKEPLLHVFMAGTGATPAEYTDLLTASATAGFHTLGLEYQYCQLSVGATAEWCQDNEPDDCGCQGDIHSVVVTGGSHPVVNVTIPNSVDGRLASALRYLHANYPKEGWDAFTRPGTVVGADTGTGTRADADTGRPLTGGTSSSSPPGDAGDRDREDGHEGVDGGTGGGHRPPLLDPAGVSIDWGRTIVSGHSQGAGHAAWLAMAHATVAGAVPISGPQDLRPDCSWVAAPGSMTPPARIVPFGHQHEDSIVPMEANWLAMQITTKDRPAVGVGDALDPRRWTGAPALLTDVPPATAVGPRPEHCSTALDLWTPKISAATALRGAGSSKGGGVGGGSDVHFTSDHRLPPSGISASPFYLGTTLENPTAVDLAIVTAEAKAKKEALYAQDVWPWLLAAAVAGKAAPPAPAPVGDLEAVQAEAGATVPPWTPRQLQRRINASIAAGVASLTMPAGDYFFDGSLVIAGASGFELRVAGGVARLWFEIGHGLLVDACDDVAVSGPFELDYTTGAHFQGTVLIVQGPSVYVRTERGWLDPDVFMAKHGHLTTSESTFGVRWTKASGLTDYVSDSTVQDEQPEKVGPGLFRYPKSAAGGLPAAVAGDKITVRIRAGYTLHTHNSSRVVYSDLKIHGSTFMAITEFGGRGGHRYQNVKVARRSSVPAANGTAMCAGRKRSCAGLIASNADAFHSSACRDGPHLDNVELSYCLDDFINVHTRVQAVGLRRPPATVGGGERLVLLDPRLSRDAGLPNDAPYGTAETLQNLRPGDNVTFYQINTLKKLATRTVASATRVLDVAAGAALAAHFSKTVNLPPDDANPPVLDCDVCGLPATAVHGNQGRSNVTENCPAGYSRAWHVELTAGQAPLPPNVTNNTLVQIEGWDASGAVVENCHFHDSDFGFRWKSSGSKIINSVIGGSRIEISPLQLYLEGALEVHSVQISGNTFTKLDAMSEPNESGCTGSTSSYAPGTCSGIVLTNNSFQPPPPSVAHITTTSAMRDHAGAPITDCLEPHIQKFGNTFYAYGFTIRNQSEQFATTIYSSEDMVTWSKRAYIPVNKTLDGPVYGEAVALWYVVYNPKTKLYMGYGANYGKWINVYRSTAPTGPFVYMHRFSKVYPYTGVGESTGAGDILIYTEGDSAYLIYNSMPMSTKWSGQHRFAYIYKLNAAWDDILVDTLTNTTAVMEGLWLFKRQGTYFLLGSHLSGYRSNDNFYLTAKSITGPWTHRGLLAPKGTNTYGSQTFQGLTISGSKGEAFIYIGHRYLPCGPQPGNCSGPFTNASNIWLPLDFSGDLLDTPLQYRDEWNLDLDGAWTK